MTDSELVVYDWSDSSSNEDRRRIYATDNTKPTNRFTICKYMSFQRAKLSLFDMANQYISFVSPNEWTDPFEYKLCNENVLQKKRLFCFCSTYSRSDNEEAMWKSYDSDFTGSRVLLFFDFIRLIDALSRVRIAGVEFYVSIIKYDKGKEELEAAIGIMATDATSVIDKMSHKRKAFKYENELRIYAIVDSDKCDDTNFFRVKLPLTEKVDKNEEKLTSPKSNKYERILSKVKLPPYKPGKKGDYTAIEYCLLQGKKNQPIRSFFYDLGYKGANDIEECRMYAIMSSTEKKRLKKLLNK